MYTCLHWGLTFAFFAAILFIQYGPKDLVSAFILFIVLIVLPCGYIYVYEPYKQATHEKLGHTEESWRDCSICKPPPISE